MIIEKEYIRLTDDNHLVVDFNPTLEVVIKISSWEEGLRVWTKSCDIWQNDDISELDFSIVAEFYEENPDHPFFYFFNDIPAGVKSRVMDISYLQVAILQIALRNDLAKNLLKTNVVLLWLFLHYWRKNNLSIAEIGQVLSKKRREIFRIIFKTGSEKHVRLLSKIKLIKGEEYELKIIRKSIMTPGVCENFRHWREIPVQSLYIFQYFPDLKNIHLLRYFSAIPKDMIFGYLTGPSDVYEYFRDTRRIGERLGIENVYSILNKIRSPEKLRKKHDEWVVRLHARQRINAGNDRRLPEPPWPGNEQILPIRTRNELYLEGKLMRHCVSSYFNTVMARKSYIYKVLFPQRATLELRKTNDKLIISQMKLFRNGIPDKETFKFVQDSLDSSSVSSGQKYSDAFL